MNKLLIVFLMLSSLSAQAKVKDCQDTTYSVTVSADQKSAELFIHGNKLGSMTCIVPRFSLSTGGWGYSTYSELSCEGPVYELHIEFKTFSGSTFRQGYLSQKLEGGVNQSLHTLNCTGVY